MGWSIGGREEILFCEVSVSDTCISAAEVPQGRLLSHYWRVFFNPFLKDGSHSLGFSADFT